MKGVELALIAACSNGVDAGTVQAVIQAESAGQALAIATNPARPLPKLTSSVDAAALLADLLARNISVDIWLMQVNSQHLQRFNVQASELLDPCVNIFVGTTILSEAYARAVAIHGPGQKRSARGFVDLQHRRPPGRFSEWLRSARDWLFLRGRGARGRSASQGESAAGSL